jgi:ribosome biogenesis protein ERB1
LIFDLVEKTKLLQLRPQVQWISSIDVHPSGDHVIAGSFDGRGFWFDTELQVEPFKVLRTHTAALRDVRYHRRFPLFATASDDTKIYVFHGTVFDDLITNPRIVPVKELSGHAKNNILGVLALVWHPTQPWLLSAGADHSIRLWC